MKRMVFKVIAVLFITVCLISCSIEDKKPHASKDEIRREQVSEVEKGQPEKMIFLPGELKPWEWVDIYAKVKGFVKDVYVDRGSVVKKGQLLAILEAPELKAELAKKESEVLEFKARYNASRATYLRQLQTSKTKGAVSENELEVAYSKMISDSSNVSSAESGLNSVKEMVNYLNIKAPFDGVVTERNIHSGALVGEDDKIPMFKINNIDKLRLTVAIPEVYSSQLVKNCIAKFSVAAFPDEKFPACIARNSHALNEEVRSLITEFDVENKKHLLKPGMYAELSIPVKRISETMLVPATAVVNSTEKVFVIKFEGNKAKWVNVKTGNTVDGKIEIFTENIKPGDLILIKASEEIRDGEAILPVDKNKI